MTENLEPTSSTEVTLQELAELIEEFEQYRERLLQETIVTAQKAKMPQKTALAKIEPELAQIDATLGSLRVQQAALATNN
jgi:hypothetical protein